jgi:LPS sulfotransferase NodH
LELTQTWQSFEEAFIATASDDNVRIHFDLGASDIPVELSAATLHRLAENPTISYIICTTPRSGSNLLSEALRLTGRAGRPQEYFLYWYASIHEPDGLSSETIKPWLLPTGAYVRKVIRQGTTPNGVFGVKVMQGYFDLIVDRLKTLPEFKKLRAPEVLESIFPNLHYIRVVRKDKIRQAVSLAKAVQSGKWYDMKGQEQEAQETSSSPSTVDWIDFRPKARANRLVYDFNQIATCYRRLQKWEKAWDTYFRKARIKPYRVIYEQFIQSYEQTTQDILGYLKVPLPEAWTCQDRHLKRQSDGINEEWTQRFIEDSNRWRFFMRFCVQEKP